MRYVLLCLAGLGGLGCGGSGTTIPNNDGGTPNGGPAVPDTRAADAAVRTTGQCSGGSCNCQSGGCANTCTMAPCDVNCSSGDCSNTCPQTGMCTLHCSSGKCVNWCGAGPCTVDCSSGGCNTSCPKDGSCQIDCSSGHCITACAAGSTCTVSCPSGHCQIQCEKGAKCSFTSCSSGDCTCTGAGCP